MKQGADAILRNSVEKKSHYHDFGRFFSSMPAIALFLLIVFSYAVVVGLGVFIGYQKHLGNIKVSDSPIETVVTAVLGLLAFILGFTFSLTWSRFANRNGLVIEQAKAIQVCYLRTGLIPEKQRTEIRKLLHEYTRILVTLPDEADLNKSLGRLDEIHMLIWKQTISLAKEDIDSELRSLFISAANELISVPVERKTVALIFRIPDVIWGSLLFLAFVGMLAFGYQAGVNGMRNVLQLPWLPVAFGLVIVLIADLNSTSVQRHFKVTHQPLHDVLNMMDQDTA